MATSPSDVVRDAGHTYWVDGVPVPSVTQILAGSLGTTWAAGEAAMRRGRAVHAAIAAQIRGDRVDVQPPLPADWAGYLEAWLRWRDATHPVLLADTCERPLANGRLWAGTPDVFGVLRMETVFDWKTGAPSPYHGPQLAGYDLLAPLPERQRRRRVLVYLRPEGTFTCRDARDVGDYRIFLAALTEWTRGVTGPDGGEED